MNAAKIPKIKPFTSLTEKRFFVAVKIVFITALKLPLPKSVINISTSCPGLTFILATFINQRRV
jgi:hypothetical protein